MWAYFLAIYEHWVSCPEKDGQMAFGQHDGWALFCLLQSRCCWNRSYYKGQLLGTFLWIKEKSKIAHVWLCTESICEEIANNIGNIQGIFIFPKQYSVPFRQALSSPTVLPPLITLASTDFFGAKDFLKDKLYYTGRFSFHLGWKKHWVSLRINKRNFNFWKTAKQGLECRFWKDKGLDGLETIVPLECLKMYKNYL